MERINYFVSEINADKTVVGHSLANEGIWNMNVILG